jgi:hypothetical protein
MVFAWWLGRYRIYPFEVAEKELGKKQVLK